MKLSSLSMLGGIVLSSACPLMSHGQDAPAQCAFGDSDCYRIQYERACAPSADGALARCRDWVRSMEPRATEGDRAARRLTAVALVEIAISLSNDATERASSRSAALSIYRDLVAADPSDVDSTIGIASLTEDPLERLNLLRRAVGLRPNSLAVFSLVRELQRRGDTEDLLEAADTLGRAYLLTPPGPGKWNLASRASGLYEDARSQDLGDAFLERVRRELRAETLLRELTQGSRTGPTRTVEILDTLCLASVVDIAGSEFCMQAIGRVAQSLPQVSPRASAQLVADRAADLMDSLSQESGPALIAADPDWRAKFSRWLDAFNEEGLGSVKTYWARASIELNPARKAQILERALQVAPKNSAILTSLGAEYMRQQQWDKAIDKYREARDLPTTRSGPERSMIDHNIQTAEKLRDKERGAPNSN